MSQKMRVVKDCFCERYLHEARNYPRPWLEELKLTKGDIVDFVEDWTNLYGSYSRVSFNGTFYDILPENLEKNI